MSATESDATAAVQCLTCSRLDMRSHPTWAVNGLGRCLLQKQAGNFVSVMWRRKCEKYTAAGDAPVAIRRRVLA